MGGARIGGGGTGDGERLVVYPSRRKLGLLALGALAFVFAGLWIGGLFGETGVGIGVLVIATYVGVPFFGFCLAYALYRLARRKPSLVVDEEGVFDNASALGAGRIRWEEIREVYAFAFRGQPMIGMVLTDEDAVLARQSPLKRGLMLVNRGLVGSVVNIPQNVLPMPVEDLLREIERRRGTERRI